MNFRKPFITAVTALAMFQSHAVTADFNRVIPLPASVTVDKADSRFRITPATTVYADKENIRNRGFLNEYLEKDAGFSLRTVSKKQKKNSVSLLIDPSVSEPEGYRITITRNGCVIAGKTPAGVFYGIQTLRKSFVPGKTDVIELPAGTITDAPRFAYRGAMLDVSRHFFNTDEVKKFLDMMALHNANVFHWHLSDDQGWRVELESHPELTEKASMRPETVIGHNTPVYDGTPHGGYYTRQEIKDIIAYAKERNITIVPEIDIPGHAQAFLTANPNLGCTGGPYELWKIWGVSEDVLCAGNEDVYPFLEDILGEVAEMFPGELFHVGGDECPKRAWKACPKCQAKIKELGIKDIPGRSAEQQLQSYVMEFAQKTLEKHGKRVIGWDEILEGGITGNAMIMSWQGEKGGIAAAKQGLDVVMAPNTYVYFDYFQTADVENEPDGNNGYLPIEKVYDYNPVPETLSPEEQKRIIGVQGCLWTAYMPDYDRVEYMALPRMAALSELQWCAPDKKNYSRFTSSLPSMLSRYDSEGYNYSRRILDVTADYEPGENGSTYATLKSVNNAPIRYTLDGTVPDSTSTLYTAPIKIDSSTNLKALAFYDGIGTGNIYDENVNLHNGSMKKITLHTTPHESWTGKGGAALNDGLHGSASRESGRWVGFRENDLVATIDLGEDALVSEVIVPTCMDKNKWTFHARRIKVETSDDNVSFTERANVEYPHITWDLPDGIRTNRITLDPLKTRYVRVTVEPDREPEGHHIHGAGYVFVDEIVIN